MKERLSNFELLRGILMFMIICVHLTGHGILDPNSHVPLSVNNWLYANIIDSFFYCCVNAFVLISGYWGLRPTLKKYLLLDIPVIIYCIIASVIIDGFQNFHFTYFIPTITNKYWFLTQYFLLYITSPILNKYIENTNQKTLLTTILMGGAVFVVVPSILHITYIGERGMDFINFSLIYLIGRYIKIYDINISLKKGFSLYLITSLIILFLVLWAGYKNGVNKGWRINYYAYNTILVYLQTLGFFFIFKNLNFKSKIINYLSPSFFYIYIIHSNPSVREHLYTDWLKCPDYYYSEYFLLHLFSCAIFIFVSCLLIDIIIRRLTLNKVIVEMSNNIESMSQNFSKFFK